MIDLLLLLVGLILLIIFKNKFAFSDAPLSLTARVVIAIVAIMTIFPSAAYYLYAYNLAQNPNFKHAEITEQVGYHVYFPTYIPDGRQQESVFHVDEEKFAGQPSAVRTTFSYPLMEGIKKDKTGLIVLLQTQVDENFKLEEHLNETITNNPNVDYSLEPIVLVGYEDRPAYTLTASFLSQVYLQTEDNVVVAALAPKEPVQNLVRMIGSVR